MGLSTWAIHKQIRPINSKIMSNFGLYNLTQMKSNFILSKLPPIEDVPIIDFMDTLKHIDNEYNKKFPLWLIIVSAPLWCYFSTIINFISVQKVYFPIWCFPDMVSRFAIMQNFLYVVIWSQIFKEDTTPGEIDI